MRFINKKAGVAACLAGAALLTVVIGSGTASADSSAPRQGDIVGVGSDTLQNGVDFLFDGAPGAASGYNTLNNLNRAFSVDATGDANGRAVYDGTCGTASTSTGLGAFCDSTSSLTPNLLPGTVILRNATNPVVRPNGSGAGVKALYQDATSAGYEGLPQGSIQFARMSRLPNSTEEGNCATTNAACGGLDVYQIATDNLAVAHDVATYDGPAGLSTLELANIYDCTYTTWGQIPGYTGATPNNKIDALIPQPSSGTATFFEADLLAADPSFVLGGASNACGIRQVEEHDPTGIYADPHPADAIEPFSTGKLALIQSGYFNQAGYTNTAGKNAYSPGTIAALTGTAPDNSPTYNTTRGLYIVIRKADEASTTPFQGTAGANWATALFTTANSFVNRSAQAPLYQAAGLTQKFKPCGVNPTSC